MLTYLRQDLFESPAQTLVNTVNTVGVMGKGVALQFKTRYPEMFREYVSLCERGALKIGTLFLWRGPNKYVLNFPTKTTWRMPSKIEYIRSGLEKFVASYKEMGISSISFPPLGCGNGNLSWEEVRPIMEHYLRPLPILVYIHDRHVKSDFVPEHLAPASTESPSTFVNFLDDIKDMVRKKGGYFSTLLGNSQFHVEFLGDGDLLVRANDKIFRVPMETLENSWVVLQKGLLTGDYFVGESAQRYKSYVLPIISELPYVNTSEVQHRRNNNVFSGFGFSFSQQKKPKVISL